MSNTDYCECTDCESVLSPTAYLVDLLHNFLDSAPANALYSVLGVLTSRRPDLLFLKLDCDNAELPIPYIDLVNEILEACVVYSLTLPHETVPPFKPLPNDTSEGAAADELAVNPENTNPQAYEALAKAVYPGTLPFNLWLATMRAYLISLGTSRWELLDTFRSAEGVLTACEALGFSAEEHAILSTADTAGTPIPDSHSVNDYYGGVGGVMFPLHAVLQPVPRFLRFTDLGLADLLALLKTRYVNPENAPAAQRLEVDTSDPCNLDAANMVNLASDEPLDRIHRFLRLWRKIGGSMFDLDRSLHAFGATAIDDRLLIQLAEAQTLAKRWNLPVVALLPLWAVIDTYRYDESLSPYHALFLHKTVTQPINPCFTLTVPPAAPEVAGQPGCTMTISAHMSAIQGALRLRADDLTLLAATVLPNDVLNLANLSALHRNALLARVLRRSVSEMLSLRALHGSDPFATPAATLKFTNLADAVRASGFTVAQLDHLYRDIGVAPAARAYAPLMSGLAQTLTRIRAENALVADPNGELTRNKLMVLYDSATTEQIVGLVRGASVWRTMLASMPVLAVSDELKQKLLYSPASQTLQFTGVMSTPERAALSAGQSLVFQGAIGQLWDQPRTFVDVTLTTFPRLSTDVAPTPFLNAALAKATLLDSVQSAAQKFAFVLAPLLAFLRDTLSRDAVTQTLSGAFKVDPALTRWMLDTGLASRAAPAQPAMNDFLDVRGVDARYFAGPAFAGPALVRLESQIDFNWAAGSPDPGIPHASFSAQWSALLLAPETQTYTLHVLANDGVRLWLDGQLLIDDWTSQTLAERSVSVELKADQLYELTLHYFQATAALPSVQFQWSTASTPKSVVPSSALHPLDNWRLFHKAVLLASTFQLAQIDLGYLVAHASDFDGLDLNRLPLHPSAVDPALFSTWGRLRGVVQLRSRLGLPDGGLAGIFGASSRAEAIVRMATATGWNADQIAWLAGPLALNLADADFQTELRLLELAACFALATRTGTSVAQLARWAATDMAGADAPAVTMEIRKAVKAGYDDASWIAVGKALNDPLRQAKRDALVSFLLAHPDRIDYTDTDPFAPKIQTPDDLYEYLLIDVQMEPCMLTSRIRQALSSVQLFVQRCLLGLEAGVEPTALSADRWAWMKQYRVWEAGRKVFMWPENWIEPRLRDDKSEFFRALETDLLKCELNNANVESAFTAYLRKLEAIARPEVMGLYVEETGSVLPGEPKQRTHVVARTRSTPQQYYYRSQIESARWTPWERISADIDGNSVLPVVWDRRLYVFWPLLAEKGAPTQGPQGTPAIKYWEIRFAYAEYQQGQWTPKRVLDKAVALGFAPKRGLVETALHAWNFSFKAITAGDSLTLQVLVQVQLDPVEVLARVFVCDLAASVDVSVCDGETKVRYCNSAVATAAMVLPGEYGPDPTAQPALLVAPAFAGDEEVELRPQAWTWRGAPGEFKAVYGLWTEYGDEPDAHLEQIRSDSLLGFVPTDFEMVVPHQFRQFDQQAAYFFQDRAHTYFVKPKKEQVWTPFGDVYTFQAQFFNHYHPAVCQFLTELHRHGLDGLLSLKMQGSVEWAPGAEFAGYNPAAGTVLQPYPQSRVEFDADAAYSLYNWELFFHAPLLVASLLHQDQRFSDADRWLRYIFNPTSRSNDPVPQRYWNFAPFYLSDTSDPQNASIQTLLSALDDQTDTDMKKRARDQLGEWADDPFNPHLLARLRPVAYQNAVVMKYVDNLVAWGDQLFTRDTIESINEATQLYVMAAKVLGQRPRGLPPMVEIPPLTYVQLGVIDEFANALEDALPLSSTGDGSPIVLSAFDGGLGANLLPYFCVPPNPKLLGYWDTIADRLFKVRHCMNIEGTVRQLQLYEPPIDPTLLVRAAALGVDMSTVLSDLNSPLPCYRFSVTMQKASELCAALKGLGAALLAALEKQDAEALASMRSGHESALLELVKQVKQSQLQDAQFAREGLDKSWELAENRRQFYEAQLAENGNGLSGHEQEQQQQLDQAQTWQAASQLLEAAAGSSHAMPSFTLGESGLASPVATAIYGGQNLGNSLHAASNVLGYIASVHNYWANEAGMQAGWERRGREWTLQMQTAAKELEQIDKQRFSADVRIDIANQEIANHARQLDNAREIEAFYREKYTSRELYDWMLSELSALYFRSYQTAYDAAKRCERAFRFELGISDSEFIQFGTWDSLRKGLLVGERLELALRQMDQAYLERNRREYEITKHVSLRRINPIALITLTQTGQCEFEIKESLFDEDHPGHLMRRLKNVSVTLPCLVGPYASINATLTLLNNKIRVKSDPEVPYEQNADGSDPRFATDFAAIQSITTSHGQTDSGLFELSFRDERYLPFEGAGAISRWRLELPRETNAFDINTVTDVVLQLKYTARAGSSALSQSASNALKAAQTDASQAPLMHMVSARHDFPDAWYRFFRPTNPDSTKQVLSLDLGAARFPYRFGNPPLSVSMASFFLVFKEPVQGIKDYVSGAKLRITVTPDGGTSWPPTELGSQPGLLKGTPQQVVEMAAPLPLPGVWEITLQESDVKLMAPGLIEVIPPTPAGHARLRTDLIEDLVIVLHSSLS